MDVIATQDRFELNVYPKRNLVLVRGEGSRVWDADGREYLDLATGHGVASLGHCNPIVVAAIREQAGKLITCPGTCYNDVRAAALKKLVEVAPKDLTRAFLCNSGSEAIEAAIKFARLTTGRTKFLAANRAFHGRTLGALSATFDRKHREDFQPLVPGFAFVAFNKLDAMDQAVDDDTAGVMIEVVQGEGGVHPADPSYLEGIRRLCSERGALLIIDEIQTGFCRTGRMFACMHSGVSPDIMTVAKAILRN